MGSMRYKRNGWFNESVRHSLAAQGISSGGRHYFAAKGVESGRMRRSGLMSRGGDLLSNSFMLGRDRYSVTEASQLGQRTTEPVLRGGENSLPFAYGFGQNSVPNAFELGKKWTPASDDGVVGHAESSGMRAEGKAHENAHYLAKDDAKEEYCETCGNRPNLHARLCVPKGAKPMKDMKYEAAKYEVKYEHVPKIKTEKQIKDFEEKTGRNIGWTRGEATYDDENGPGYFAKK